MTLLNKSSTTIKKRHFPKLGRCCYCLSDKASVIVSTLLVLVWLVLSNIYLSKVDVYGILEIIAAVITAISLILLLIGVNKVNLTFLRQFKYVFLIYIVALFLIVILYLTRLFSDSFRQKGVAELKKKPNYSNKSNKGVEHIFTYTWILSTSIRIIILILIIFYYFVTCSYIEDVEQRVGEEYSIRDFENSKDFFDDNDFSADINTK
ncbi:hypothetical protein BCR32DRAFT_265970 [Anaeromyces robustus]|uniref:MARVEL domain-containing protein n=1 Tax=Anaeromyces robustus TaxID=1754192 RepID=A0A1Y1XGR1_9FUNG|nr:hypothetical protein BCR32DRAFT_265970 [Anaeromyces robustus]|eukprot:ORX84931.1 hypothetical protein BCR32DRAFT_265970 [Anaeromyces robustus]